MRRELGQTGRRTGIKEWGTREAQQGYQSARETAGEGEGARSGSDRRTDVET